MPGYTPKLFDRIPHNEIIAEHLKTMSKASGELFKREMEGGNLKGATPENKVDSYLAMVVHLETLLIPYVSEVDSPKRIVEYKEKYFPKRIELLARFKKAMENNKLLDAFFALDEWEKILMVEISNQGLLMRRNIDAIQ